MKLAALAFLLLGSDDKIVEVVCPVDGTKFKAVSVGFHPGWGGIDRDFCSHAVREVPLELKVWVCPTCWFAGFQADFDPKTRPPADAIKKIQGNLKPLTAIAKGADQKKIPGATKFDLLAQVGLLRGSGPEDIGKAYLYASWVVRGRGAVFPVGFEEFEELYSRQGLAKNPLDMKDQNKTELDLKVAAKVEKELESKPPKDLALLLNRYLVLYLLRFHGEHERALKWIEVLEKAKGENSIIDQAVQAARQSIDEERGFQKKAVEQFIQAVSSGKLSAKAQAETEYLIGELSRRIGDREAALSWLQKVLDRDGKDEFKDLVKIAREQKALLDKK